jgi:hypothetical protein
LIFLLISRKQHIIWQTAAWHGPLGSHGMALAGQTPRTHGAVGKQHTALPLDIDRTLGLGCLGLGRFEFFLGFLLRL